MPRSGDWRGPGGDKWIDYHKIVSAIQASLEQNLTDGEIRKFFGVHPLVELTAAKRRRMARLKARQVLSALRSAIIAGLVEDPDKGVRIDGFVRFRARRNVGYGAIKPRGVLYATDGSGMIVQRSQLVELNCSVEVEADTFRGDFPPLGLIDQAKYTVWPTPGVSLGPNNEPSAPGICWLITWQKLVVRKEIAGQVTLENWRYPIYFAFLGMQVFNFETRHSNFYLMDKNPVLTDYGITPKLGWMTISQYEAWAKAMPAPKDAWGLITKHGAFQSAVGEVHADRYAECFPQKRWFFWMSGQTWRAVDWVDNYSWWEMNGRRIDEIRGWGWFIPPDPKTHTARRTGYVTAKFEPGILP